LGTNGRVRHGGEDKKKGIQIAGAVGLVDRPLPFLDQNEKKLAGHRFGFDGR